MEDVAMSDRIGWVKIHRALIDSEVFVKPEYLKVWIWCLLKANHKNKYTDWKIGKNTTTLKVNRGQFIFGRNTASDELLMNGSLVYRVIQWLSEKNMIRIQPNSHYSLITIINYDTYQNDEEKTEQPSNRQRTAIEQAANTNNNINNSNNVNNDNKLPFQKFWNQYGKKVDTKKCQKKWDSFSLNVQKEILESLPDYIESTPNKKFRKNPLTYLNGECWKDEILNGQPDSLEEMGIITNDNLRIYK